jgi:hypothetical protein
MRRLQVVAIITVLAVSTSSFAQPLAPGKPAGVQRARHGASTGLLIAGTALVAGLVAVVVFKGSDDNTGVLTSGSATTTS